MITTKREFLDLMYRLEEAAEISEEDIDALENYMYNVSHYTDIAGGGFSLILYHACRTNKMQVVKLITKWAIPLRRHLLNEPSSSQMGLHEAVIRGNDEMVKHLLEFRVDVNSAGGNHYRKPLHYAAENGNINIAKLLLDKGAIVNARDNNGITPYMVALEERDLDMIGLLSSRGGKKNHWLWLRKWFCACPCEN